ncbi:MAG: MFS transporter [Gammaproteobacteria bacterium]|nr:MFS transporter [Gammaproteobacteria bacterium]
MPQGAGALFLIQIFSTFGFSVLYSTLILYATQGLHMSDKLATSITGSFVALNYFLHLLGGYIGGRFLSYRGLFAVGMALQIIGCLLISVPESHYLLWGLAAFLGGSGLNITCINCMVTQLFEPDDKRREAAFLWNYSGMNIGFFVGFSLGGYFHLLQAYQELFLLSAGGNLIALIITFFNWKTLKDRQTSFSDAAKNKQRKAMLIGVTSIVVLFFSLRILLEHTALCNQLIILISIAMFILLIGLATKQKGLAAQSKMWGYIILALAALIFWTLYQLAPMGLNLFVERNVDRHFFNFIIAPQWIQNINTLVIIFGGPLLSILFSHLRDRGITISIPLQFSLALGLIGLSLCVLPIGIHFANAQGFVNFNWVLLAFILMSMGELFIAPIGYAMVGQLAPLHLQGLMMGIWMMVIGFAAIFSHYFSKMALGTIASTDPLLTNPSYSHTFNLLGWSAIGAGLLLFIATPVLTRLTQERKKTHVTTSLWKENLAN